MTELAGPRRTVIRRGLSPVARIWPPVLTVAIIAAAWEVVSDTDTVPSSLLPSLSRVLEQGWQNHTAIWKNTLPTIEATVAGFAASVAVSFVIAIVLDFSTILRRAILPVLIVSQTLPIVAIAPLIILWFGFYLTPKILLVALVTFFPMVIGLLRGFSSAEPDAEKLLRSMGAGRLMIFQKIRLPASMPSFFSGLRVSITYAVVGAIFAEYAGAISGLGVYMQVAKNSFRTDLVLAAVLVSAVLTLILFSLVVLIERVSLPWLRIERGTGPGW